MSTIAALDLQRKDIPPIKWVVQNLLPAGLNILASPPKYGKSWAVLDLCLSVASGGSFLGFQTNQCGCLYLALEDSERRLKNRMCKLLDGKPAPLGFDFATAAPTLSTGLVDVLEEYMRQHTQTGLIIVDTLQKVRDMSGGKDVYGRDYSDIGTLKRFADSHNIALLLIHHLRKMDDSDPFARISGTNGLSGAADTMMVLEKAKREDENATLHIVGRDVENTDIVLNFNKVSCRWVNLGDVEAFAEQQARAEYMNSPIVRTVKKLLEQSPEGWSGPAQHLMDAGRFITRTSLADSTRALTNKLKGLSELLLECDGIAYEYKPNGTGGGKHHFYYVDSPQFEELDQSTFDPFSEG